MTPPLVRPRGRSLEAALLDRFVSLFYRNVEPRFPFKSNYSLLLVTSKGVRRFDRFEHVTIPRSRLRRIEPGNIFGFRRLGFRSRIERPLERFVVALGRFFVG